MQTPHNEGNKLALIHVSGSLTLYWPVGLHIDFMPRALVFHSQSSKEDEQTPLKLFKHFPVRLNKTKKMPLERPAFV